jgi:glucose-6-phosphate 1-epimerase
MRGHESIVLRSSDGATAEVYLQGAHVSSWCPSPGDDERLFLSARSEFRDGVAIRGGIPVIFPQFAAEGPLPRHGFARTSKWTLEGTRTEPTGRALASLTLSHSAATHKIWPACFLTTLTVRVGGPRLDVELSVENTGTELFAFTAALHTYLRVHDVRAIELAGLQGSRYRETALGELKADQDESIRVTGEIDRVYVNAPHRLELREPERQLGIETTAFRDVVVWNPGAKAAAEMKDMEPDGNDKMLCVEAGVVQSAIRLDAGRRWSGSQSLIAEQRA